jgi:hypothetical protein
MFIEFSRKISELWFISLFVCIILVLTGYALSCNDLQCAIIIIQVMLVVFCFAWGYIAWKIIKLMEKKMQEKETGVAPNN